MGFGYPRDWREALVASDPAKFALPEESDMRFNWAHARLSATMPRTMRELAATGASATAASPKRRGGRSYLGSRPTEAVSVYFFRQLVRS